MDDLIVWAEGAGMLPVARRDDDLVHLADMSLAFSIGQLHGVYPVAASTRGGPRAILGVFDDVEDARRFLAMELGAVRRRRASLPTLAARALPPGFVIEEAPTALLLSWFTGSAEFPKALRLRAVNFSRVERAPLEAIEASFLEAEGRPLYAE